MPPSRPFSLYCFRIVICCKISESIHVYETAKRDVKDIYTDLMLLYVRIVRQVTGLLLSNLYKYIAEKSIWKSIDIFPDQALTVLNISTEHGKIIAAYTK